MESLINVAFKINRQANSSSQEILLCDNLVLLSRNSRNIIKLSIEEIVEYESYILIRTSDNYVQLNALRSLLSASVLFAEIDGYLFQIFNTEIIELSEHSEDVSVYYDPVSFKIINTQHQ